MCKHRLMTALLGAAAIFGTTTAFAQEPVDDGSVFGRLREKGEEIADETQIVERLNGDIDGWYPRLGGMTRGGGFALGPGYRFHVTDDGIFVDLSAGLSLKGYKSADVNVRWVQALADRVEFWTDFRYEDFPQENFFGLGLESTESGRTSYRFSSNDLSARALFKPSRWFNIGGRLGYVTPEIGPGTDKGFPSIETLFTDLDAPGLATQPDYVHTEFFSEADFRDRRGNPASGGFYRASIGFIDDRGRDQYDHRRLDALAAQYVPNTGSRKRTRCGSVPNTASWHSTM